MAPDWFARCLDIPGATVIALQPEAPAAALTALGPAVLNAGPALADFADTAAVVAGLDLVISVDTSLAHLAASLGVATWTLLDFAADWRWLRGRDDTPWYPTMRLFRQERPGEWQGVIDRVRQAAAEIVIPTERSDEGYFTRDRLTP